MGNHLIALGGRSDHSEMTDSADVANDDVRYCIYCGKLDALLYRVSDGKRCPHSRITALKSSMICGDPAGTHGPAKGG